MPTTINAQLDSTIQSFVSEISSLVRVAALEAVRDALGGGESPARRGRPAGSGRKPGGPAKAAMPARPTRGGRRLRRSGEDVEATAEKILAFVKANDGKRLEEISTALKIPTADLKLPAQKLLAAKAVKTTGAKRGTMYHLACGPAPKAEAASAKAGKRAKKAWSGAARRR